MRFVSRLSWIVLLLGCSEVSTPQTAPVEMIIQANDFVGQTVFKPLEGVQVCEGDTDENCHFSNANGEVTIYLPVDQEIFYTIQKEDYDSILIAQVIPESGNRTFWVMWADGVSADFYKRVMSPYPRRGTGEIYIEIQEPFAGATFELVDATGKAYYSVENPDESPLDPTATTPRGVGGFVEVTPGEHEVKIGGTADSCSKGSGWPGDSETTVIVPVRGDYASYVILRCPQP